MARNMLAERPLVLAVVLVGILAAVRGYSVAFVGELRIDVRDLVRLLLDLGMPGMNR